MLVFAPMPMVRAVSAAKVNPGLLRRVRRAWRISCHKVSNQLRSHIPDFLWSFVDSMNLIRLSLKLTTGFADPRGDETGREPFPPQQAAENLWLLKGRT